jgi:hypothetical protein
MAQSWDTQSESVTFRAQGQRDCGSTFRIAVQSSRSEANAVFVLEPDSARSRHYETQAPSKQRDFFEGEAPPKPNGIHLTGAQNRHTKSTHCGGSSVAVRARPSLSDIASSFLGGLRDHFVSLPGSASLSCAVAKSIAGPAGTIPVGLIPR